MESANLWMDLLKDSIIESEGINYKSKELIIETKKVLQILDGIFQNAVLECKSEFPSSFKLELDSNKEKIFELLEDINTLNNKNLNTNLEVEELLVEAESSIKIFHEKINTDTLTWLYNLEYYNKKIDLLIKEWLNFNYIFFDINDLWLMNNTYWHNRWDNLLFEFWKNLISLFWDKNNDVFRIHWDEFIILSRESTAELENKIEKLHKWLDNRSLKFLHEWKQVKYNINFASWISQHIWGIDEEARDIKKRADQAMYLDKIKRKK